jgi:hypothetical protein
LVENCDVNLLSISKLAKDLNCEVIFKSKNVFFQDQFTKETIGAGFLENGLYFLNMNKIVLSSKKDEDLCEL